MADWFALGILLAVVRSASDVAAPLDALRRTVDRFGDAVFGLALVAFVVVGNVGLPTDGTSGTVGQDVAREVLFGLVGLLIVAPAALGRSYRSVGIRALDCRVAVLVGTISYGVFLWHYQWIARLQEWGGFDWMRSARTLSVFVMVLGLTLVTAGASWLLVERPLLRYKDRLGGRRTGTPPAPRVSTT
jgi:peptidoglycan/LPS O-acetylase OafA/YrhL